MKKIIEIFKAWGIMLNPNELQDGLALKRMEICNQCDDRVDSPFIHCGICKCPLKAKVYASSIGACPKNKWISVELEWQEKYKKL